MIPFNLVSPGGIGDIIISIPILKEIHKQCGDFHEFSLWSQYPEVAKMYLPEFKDHKQINKTGTFNVTEHGGLWLSVIDTPIFKFAHKEVTLHVSMKKMFNTWMNAREDWGILIDKFPFSVHQIAHKAVAIDMHRVDLPRYLLGLKCDDYTPPESVNQHGNFITIHDGYDISMDLRRGYSTKNWPLRNWEEFVSLFKKKHPDLKVYQLGTEKSRPIAGADHSLLGKTNWTGTTYWLEHSLCHVDGESGLVHARRLYKKPSVVMFGPTLMEYYAYPENENITSDVCYPCFWISPQWQNECFLAKTPDDWEPKCMASIAPNTVFQRVNKVLGTSKLD